MPMGAREEPFAAFVHAYRPRLVGTAALIHLDAAAAPALVDAVLAHVYAAWPQLDDPYAYALRALLDPARVGIRQSGTAATSFDLVDVEPIEARPDEDIRSELACLSRDERQILVLASYARLPLSDLARVLDREPGDVVGQLQSAHRRLEEMPRRHQRRRLSTELAAAGRTALDAAPSTDTPRAGRAVLWRRRVRIAALAAALLVVAAFGVRQALPPPAPVAAGAPSASQSPTPSPPCDTSEERCRVRLVSAWRSEMAEVISSHLDPQGSYFTGYSYSYTEDYQGSRFWNGGGALALDLYRMREGATEVYLQIATSRQYAIRCGQLTGRTCQTQRFMDGNRFNLTDPFDVAHGLEVQHRPEGTYVITVVARNTSRASRELPVTRADLVDLVADPRLRLPPR